MTGTGQFSFITNNTNTNPIFLDAGTHTASRVLTDLGDATGVLIGPSEFSTVPEPPAYAVAGCGIAALGLPAQRRGLQGGRADHRGCGARRHGGRFVSWHAPPRDSRPRAASFTAREAARSSPRCAAPVSPTS